MRTVRVAFGTSFQSIRTTSIRGKLTALAGVAILTLSAFALVSFVALSEVRIGGQRYQVINENNVLLADVLPPPAYLVEADLVAHQLLLAAESGDTAQFDELEQRVTQLRADYENRQAYWTADTTLDAETRRIVTEVSADPGRRFLDLLERQYLPALRSGELATARELLLHELNDTYELHRRAVDQIVARTGQNAAETERAARSLSSLLMKLLVGALLLALVVLGALSSVIGRSISRPLDRLRHRLADIASGGGDLRTRLAEDGEDELAEVARSFNRFVASLAHTIGEIRHQAEALSAEATLMRATSIQLSESSVHTEEQTAALADASAQVAGAIDEVMHAAQEIQQAVGEISRSASTAATIAANGVDAAARADAVMEQLNTASGEINTVVGAITTIAEQTNLLALNATIEAARAGDAGTGFAVVASEVKGLARATADATTGIGPRVDAMHQSTESATNALEDVRRVIGDISSAQAVIAAAVEQQTATTREIESHVSMAAASANAITDSIAHTLEITGETAQGAAAATASAVRVSETADALHRLVAQFSV